MLGTCSYSADSGPGPGPVCSFPLFDKLCTGPLLLLCDFTLHDLLLGPVFVFTGVFRGLPRAPCLSAESERSRVLEVFWLTERDDTCVLLHIFAVVVFMFTSFVFVLFAGLCREYPLNNDGDN